VLAGAVASLVGLIVADQVPADTLLPLAGTVALLVAVSPIQDHVRTTFHLAHRPLAAVLVSAVQLVLVGVMILPLHLMDVPPQWIPFGVLAFANAGSLAAGLIIVHRLSPRPITLPSSRSLLKWGSALLPMAAFTDGSGFAAAALLASLASAADLGSAEAARIVARPILVLSLGLNRATSPRIMEAGLTRSRDMAMQSGVLYCSTIGVMGVLYLAIAGWPTPINPFTELAESAYRMQGLAALTLIAATITALAFVPRFFLLGARSNRDLLLLTGIEAVVRISVVAVTAGLIGAYSIPVSHLVATAVFGPSAMMASKRLLKAGGPLPDTV
jgi:hypothetical protein